MFVQFLELEDLTAMTEEERKVPTTIEELGISIHVKARTSPYPNTAIRRFPVPDNKVSWDVSSHILLRDLNKNNNIRPYLGLKVLLMKLVCKFLVDSGLVFVRYAQYSMIL